MTNNTNAVHITLYDVSGAPLDPVLVTDLLSKVEKVAKKEKQLAINVARS